MKDFTDLGKWILRVSVGGLLLFHGMHKVLHGHEYIRTSLANVGLPEFLWYGVPFAEIIAPLFLILGLFTHISSLLIAYTMMMTFYLVLGREGLDLNQFGGLSGELNLLFLFTSLAIFFLGPGNYSLYRGPNFWIR